MFIPFKGDSPDTKTSARDIYAREHHHRMHHPVVRSISITLGMLRIFSRILSSSSRDFMLKLIFNVASIITMMNANMLTLSSDAQTTDEFIGDMKTDTYFDIISFWSQSFINDIKNLLNKIHSGDKTHGRTPISYDFNDEYNMSLPIAAESLYIYGSIPVDLPQINKRELVKEHLDLLLMYAIGNAARSKTESAGKIALGIKESQLSEEQVAAYRSVKYLLFHYWSNPVTYKLEHNPLLVDRAEVPEGYLIRQEKEAVKFLLLDYDPQCPTNIGECNILKTQRRGEIRYLPFVTTVDSIRIE